jgi:hypothetical protein
LDGREAEGLRKLQNEGEHTFYASQNIIRVIKSRSIRWVKHTVRMREMINVYKILIGTSEGSIYHLEDLGVTGR